MDFSETSADTGNKQCSSDDCTAYWMIKRETEVIFYGQTFVSGWCRVIVFCRKAICHPALDEVCAAYHGDRYMLGMVSLGACCFPVTNMHLYVCMCAHAHTRARARTHTLSLSLSEPTHTLAHRTLTYKYIHTLVRSRS